MRIFAVSDPHTDFAENRRRLQVDQSGGALGVVLAIIVSYVIGFFLPELPASVPMLAVLSGMAVSTGVGLVFGVWPAKKAANLDPIECLRYE